MSNSAVSQPAKSGKGKNKKGQTVSLSEFLGKDIPTPLVSQSTWAEEMDQASDNESSMKDKLTLLNQRSALPSAPKSSRKDLDMTRIPSNPPFKVYVGNLPFETCEDDLKLFFKGLNIVEVNLPTNAGRAKGFGYVEFSTRDGLITALGKSDEMMQGRNIRVDFAESSSRRSDATGGHRDGPREGKSGPPQAREEVETGDWRGNRAAPPGPPPGFEGDRDRNGYDRGMSSQPAYRNNSRRDYGRRSPVSAWNNRRSPSPQRAWRSPPRQHSPRRLSPRRASPRRSPPRLLSPRRSSPRQRSPSPSREKPASPTIRERPRLQLAKRTIPVETDKSCAAPTAIFGSARPVDTAQRERVIEERLRKLQDEEVQQLEDRERRGLSRRQYSNETDNAPRQRLSSGGSGAHVVRPSASNATRRVSGDSPNRALRTRVDSEFSQGDDDVLEESSKNKNNLRLTASVESKVLVPAPPPAVNIWEKRKQQQATKAPSSEHEEVAKLSCKANESPSLPCVKEASIIASVPEAHKMPSPHSVVKSCPPVPEATVAANIVAAPPPPMPTRPLSFAAAVGGVSVNANSTEQSVAVQPPSATAPSAWQNKPLQQNPTECVSSDSRPLEVSSNDKPPRNYATERPPPKRVSVSVQESLAAGKPVVKSDSGITTDDTSSSHSASGRSSHLPMGESSGNPIGSGANAWQRSSPAVASQVIFSDDQPQQGGHQTTYRGRGAGGRGGYRGYRGSGGTNDSYSYNRESRNREDNYRDQRYTDSGPRDENSKSVVDQRNGNQEGGVAGGSYRGGAAYRGKWRGGSPQDADGYQQTRRGGGYSQRRPQRNSEAAPATPAAEE